ncbi:hypothetical protein V1289_000456 [Bradyrhizobium sp. AZCC 2289]
MLKDAINLNFLNAFKWPGGEGTKGCLQSEKDQSLADHSAEVGNNRAKGC